MKEVRKLVHCDLRCEHDSARRDVEKLDSLYAVEPDMPDHYRLRLESLEKAVSRWLSYPAADASARAREMKGVPEKSREPASETNAWLKEYDQVFVRSGKNEYWRDGDPRDFGPLSS